MSNQPPVSVREWATSVALLPRARIVERVIELRHERDAARVESRDWKAIAAHLTKQLDQAGAFEAHLKKGNERPIEDGAA